MIPVMTISKHSTINITLICIILFLSLKTNAQSDKKYIRQGNREYAKDKYSESEILYRKAGNKDGQSPDAVFNIGDALYKQNKFEDAGKQFIDNANQNEDKAKKSASFYNLGNSLLKANKVQESIDAYKNSLKLRPDNKEAKYNLSYAQDLLKKQQEQKQKQQQQDKNKQDQNKDQNKNKEDQNKDKQNQDQKDKKDQQNDKKNQQQQQQQGISKEDAERLLNALANDEKNVEKKVELEKAARTRVRSIKNW